MSYDFFAQTQELTLADLLDKEKLQQWKNKHDKPKTEWLTSLDLSPPEQIMPAIEHLPRLSFGLTLQFRLANPYISRDETSFYIIENPVRKEWVFKVPYVAPSSWKGALRAALWQELGKTVYEADKHIKRLFGEVRDNETGQAGCLHLYPTFFDQIGLEVINPHDRKTGVGKRGPIYFECVPAQATGRLTMLYVPIKVPADASDVAEDLHMLAEGVVAMLTTYGFGAKTSSGYGTAEDKVTGHLVMNHSDTDKRPVAPSEPRLPDSVQLFRDKYPTEDFAMKPKEWRSKNQATGGDQNAYKKARADFSEYQQQVEMYQQQKADYEAALLAPLPLIHRQFSSLQELEPMAQEIVSEILGSPEDKQ